MGLTSAPPEGNEPGLLVELDIGPGCGQPGPPAFLLGLMSLAFWLSWTLDQDVANLPTVDADVLAETALMFLRGKP